MSVADEIDKLSKLRASGALSDDEFEQQKKSLLTPTPNNPSASSSLPNDWSAIALQNKFWFQLVLIVGLIPVGIGFMLFCAAYRYNGGKIVRVSKWTKALLIALFTLIWIWWLALFSSKFDASRFSSSPGGTSSPTSASVPDSKSSDTSANASNTPSPSTDTTSNSPPGMRVESEEGNAGNFLVKIIGDDDQPFTVRRVVVNGRAGEQGCDSEQKIPGSESENGFPATLKRGSMTFAAVACGALLSAEVYTDRGTASFKFN